MTDKCNMKSSPKRKQVSEHRPNGLIAELRAAAPEANKKLVSEKNKEARQALAESRVKNKALFRGISQQMITRILSSR